MKISRIFAILVICLIALSLWRIDFSPPPKPLSDPSSTVVLVTLDGIRLKELLSGIDPKLSGGTETGSAMPFMMDTLVPKSVFLGDDIQGNRFTLGNPSGISIPSYQSIFKGRPTVCFENSCNAPWGRNLISDLQEGLPDDRLAYGFFSYSSRICETAKVTALDGQVVCGAGEIEGNSDTDHEIADKIVIDAALHHLETARPAFLYIALGESDSAGHSGVYQRYVDVLAQYDAFLKRLHSVIERMAQGGDRVTLLVTTDHGRGEGAEWGDHGWVISGSNRLWLLANGYGIGRTGKVLGGRKNSLYDVRATVQYLLGLKPPRGVFQGRVMTDILAPPDP